MDIISWGNIAFYVNAKEIKGIKDLTLDAKLDTEDKTEDGQKFVKVKNKGSYTVTMTAVLQKALNVDVQKTALELTEAARLGKTGYIYCGGKKLLTPQFMMTEAKVSNININKNGQWLGCEAALTLKQSSKGAGDGGGGGGGGGGGRMKQYTVLIPGLGQDRTMQSVKVWATSIQDAINKAKVGQWTGFVLVDNKRHYVIKGTLNDDAYKKVDTDQKDQDKAKKDADKQSQKVWDDAHKNIKQPPVLDPNLLKRNLPDDKIQPILR